MLTIIALDDHPLILKQIRTDIEAQPDLDLAAVSGDPSALLPLVRRHRPDVVVLDLYMGPGAFDPPAAVRQLKAEFPHTSVLILTGLAADGPARELAEAGASGYLLKSDDLSLALPKAIRAVAAGRPFFSADALSQVLAPAPPAGLNPQERSVLRLAAKGLVNARIGAALGISAGRVRNILTGIYEQLDVQGDPELNPRTAAIARARALALLDGEGRA